MAHKAGDVVRLKSGGPPMTVERDACVWHGERGDAQRAQFPAVALKAVPEDELGRGRYS